MPPLPEVHDTLIVWRRTGKEHGEDTGFRANPPEIVDASLRRKADDFRRAPPSEWSWWRFSDNLLVEKNLPGGDQQVLYYHLPERHCMIVENATIPRLGPDWTWYVHMGDLEWRSDLECWVFTDLFIDVLVHRDCRTHTLVDLDDLAQAIDIGLLTPDRASGTLRHAQTLIDTIRSGDFPPPQILSCRETLHRRGLVP